MLMLQFQIISFCLPALVHYLGELSCLAHIDCQKIKFGPMKTRKFLILIASFDYMLIAKLLFLTPNRFHNVCNKLEVQSNTATVKADLH